MNREFLPYQESLELKELGFKEKCAAHYVDEYDSELELKWKIYRNLSFNTDNCVQAPLFQQAFRFFRDKFNFRYSIGNTNVSVVHYGTTQLLQDNATYEDAELATIRFFIEKAKQQIN